MVFDSAAATDSRHGEGNPRTAAKVRVRFRKDGLLRLVSHLDLLHVFERLLRRAEIPFRSTQGFHPQPRIVFALSLALGVVGCEEVVEIELERPMGAPEILRHLAHHAPPGLQFLNVRSIDVRARAQVIRVRYRITPPAEHRTDLPRRIEALLDSSHLLVERTRPKPRRLDVRPFLHNVCLDENELEISLWVDGSAGSARPEEILGALGLADVLNEGAILERSKLELRDEVPETEAGPELAPALTGPQLAGAAPKLKDHRPAPLLPGPLSFDS
jgi:radical SAM-linked protein